MYNTHELYYNNKYHNSENLESILIEDPSFSMFAFSRFILTTSRDVSSWAKAIINNCFMQVVCILHKTDFLRKGSELSRHSIYCIERTNLWQITLKSFELQCLCEIY